VVDYEGGPGYANIARAVVALPHSEFLDQAHIRTVCTRVQFKKLSHNPPRTPGRRRDTLHGAASSESQIVTTIRPPCVLAPLGPALASRTTRGYETASAAKQCPKGSIYGQARAVTPLLDQPLEGPLYLRSSDNPLPDLVVALHGQAFRSRAKTKSGQDAERVNGSAVHPTEDAPRRRFAAVSEGLDRLTGPCQSSKK
jgi:hypothetical protein